MFSYNNFSPYTSQAAGMFSSPYQPPQMQPQEIIKVNGENGARALAARMAPNSSSLVLDEANPLVWVIRTDGAGYPSISAFSISPHKTENAVSIDFEKRLRKLEEWYESNTQPTAGKSEEK